jgi:phage terminase large subunit-like protein
MLLVDDIQVISSNPIGSQEVYDFEVAVHHCYITAGVVHHNTEGVGAYEMTCHLTGRYPSWWAGRRFDAPVHAWAAGDTTQTVRDIVQFKLLGPVSALGTGMIPGEFIRNTSRRAGSVSDCIETVAVDHKSGGTSILTLKSYDQGRQAFQGTERHVVWLDEEPPLDVYTECLLRTMATAGGFGGGIVLATFTPLLGLSEVVMSFLPGGRLPDPQSPSVHDGKWAIMASWDDAPHLGDEEKRALLASIPPFQRDARSRGIPQLGSGAIYPVPEEDVRCDPFPIPDEWSRAYGLDVGWNKTAGLWVAKNPDTGVLYVYSDHKRGAAEPVVHAQAIKGRGEWIRGAVDPASLGSSQRDGSCLFDEYTALGLDLVKAPNAVETGIARVWTLLSTGQLKVFSTCSQFWGEYRIYRRDEKGRVVKENDHLMDCLRYVVAALDDVLTEMPLDAFSRRAGLDGRARVGHGLKSEEYNPLWDDEGEGKEDEAWKHY